MGWRPSRLNAVWFRVKRELFTYKGFHYCNLRLSLMNPSANVQQGDIYPVARLVAGSGRLMFVSQ